MDWIQGALEWARPVVPLLAVLTVFGLGGFLLWRLLEGRRRPGVEVSFRSQLVMSAVTLAAILAVVMALPIDPDLQSQLLGLIGLLLSAAIALASTTFLGNALAGVLLHVVGSFRIGDFVRVGEQFGRVSERGLFHTEIQTEDRDLTTVPNLYLVTNPVRVVRTSGTIISATVSLGYDVSRRRVKEVLLAAAESVELAEPFVQILELGDFSVTYRVAGLLTDVERLLSRRSRLRGAMLDRLHAAGIEIVSPTFMNTRALAGDLRIVPHQETASGEDDDITAPPPESVVFDKAAEAQQKVRLENDLKALESELAAVEASAKEATDEAEMARLEVQRRALAEHREALAAEIGAARSAQEKE